MRSELCDLCGVVVSDGTEVYALVWDSSAIHAVDPDLDGRRMIIACCDDHLTELIGQYKRRPFLRPELWAGQIARAMERHPEGLGDDDLIAETGLDPGQIEVGVMWHNLEFIRWHRRFGEGDGPQTDE